MKVQGLGFSNILSIKGIEDVLQKLKIGDKLSVQIVGVSGNELTLRLANGTSISAAALFPIDVALGDFLELSVKNKSNSQIILETVKNSYEESKTNEIVNNLLSLRMPPNERNIDIGRAIINQHLALNKKNFNEVVRIISNFADMDIQKAAFISANSIDSVEDGVELLKQAENNKLDIGKNLHGLIKDLASQKEEVVNSIISKYAEKIIAHSVENQNREIQNLFKYFDGSQEQTDKLVGKILNQIFNGLNGVHRPPNSLLNESITREKLGHLLANPKILTEENVDLTNYLNANKGIEEKVLNALNDKVQLKKFILDYTESSPVMFKKHSEDMGVFDKIKNFLSPKNIIRDNRINTEIDVNKLYEEMNVKLEAIEELISIGELAVNKDNIQESVNQIRRFFDFSTNINNLFNYFQLPVNINQKDTTVDLYFVKNTKGQNKINPDSATLFISLNTQNIGVVEVLIGVNYGKIDLNFRLDNEKIIDYFSKYQNKLEKLIDEKGYTINKLNYSINVKRTNIISFEHLIHETRTAVKDVFDARV